MGKCERPLNGVKTMQNEFKQVDICYKYDGSFYGMLSCVFEAFLKKEIPIQVLSGDDACLFGFKYIETDEEKAKRILKAVLAKINSTALEYVKLSFLASIQGKEIALIHLLKDGFSKGSRFIELIRTGFTPVKSVVVGGVKNEHIKKLEKGISLLTLEAQRFIQFVRFSEVDGALVSIIEPEHNVLPLLADHFVSRFPNEKFLIYDKTHGLGLLYVDKEIKIETIESFELPKFSQEEKNYQKLWRLFYNTIAIQERKNERCRMNFMPKKYWKNMTEFMAD